MKHSLRSRMIFSFLIVALATVLVVTLFIRFSSNQSLMNLVAEQQVAQLKETVIQYYEENQTLDGFSMDLLRRFNPQSPPDGELEPPSPLDSPIGKPDDIRGIRGLVDVNSVALIPTAGLAAGAAVPEAMLNNAVPVKVNGEVIAWILPDSQLKFKLSAEEELFQKRTVNAIILAGILGVLIAILMGILLSRKIIQPIQRLTDASSALAAGQLSQAVPVTSDDEIGQLTRTFNQMSHDLQEADLQRKRLTADITHDLSTPMQIISGYIEMAEEDHLEMTPQRVQIIKTELDHLKRLVSDLTILTQAETGTLPIQQDSLNLNELLEQVVQSYQALALKEKITLILKKDARVPLILADEGRMVQVLHNLMDNAFRYTPTGGTITLALSAPGKVRIEVIDSGSGIDPEDLPYVFDRFFRADKTRNSNAGKMGLGLAICKALVAAQGGQISVHSDGSGKGTCFRVEFPPA